MDSGSAKFEDLTTVLMKIHATWDMMPYQTVKFCVLIFSVTIRLDPEEGGY